jgi:hypothetical protein
MSSVLPIHMRFNAVESWELVEGRTWILLLVNCQVVERVRDGKGIAGWWGHSNGDERRVG